METSNLENNSVGTETPEESKQSIKVRVTFIADPVIRKFRTGDVFFKRSDVKSEYEEKLLALATEPKNGEVNGYALHHLLKRYGWIVTNHLNTKQVKAFSLSNKLKKKVFTGGLKNIYTVKRIA